MFIEKDELWKSIIEDLFDHFLHFFYPDFVDQVDFDKPYSFLDKELQRLEVDTKRKGRRADLLAKVFLKNGTEVWMLIHIEVQGYEDVNFPNRMFIYKYRIFDRLNAPLTALAILTDDNPNYHPKYYEEKTWNTTLRYDFATFKLLDYDADYFDQFDNPFAIVMKTARIFLRNKAIKTDQDKLAIKMQLAKNLFAKGYSKQEVGKILLFIKVFAKFDSEDYYEDFENEIDKITGNQPTMGIVELVEKKLFEQGVEVGIERGVERGVEQGIGIGRKEEKVRGDKKVALRLLIKGFSDETILGILNISPAFLNEVKKEQAAIPEIEALLAADKDTKFIQDQLNVSAIFIQLVRDQEHRL